MNLKPKRPKQKRLGEKHQENPKSQGSKKKKRYTAVMENQVIFK